MYPVLLEDYNQKRFDILLFCYIKKGTEMDPK
jgi:hypothetical protein